MRWGISPIGIGLLCVFDQFFSGFLCCCFFCLSWVLNILGLVLLTLRFLFSSLLILRLFVFLASGLSLGVRIRCELCWKMIRVISKHLYVIVPYFSFPSLFWWASFSSSCHNCFHHHHHHRFLNLGHCYHHQNHQSPGPFPGARTCP